MKYIKEYNSTQHIITQSDLDDIKDIFRDLVDEYDMILYHLNGDHFSENVYISYNFFGYNDLYGKSHISYATGDDLLNKIKRLEIDRLEIRIFAPVKNHIVIPFQDKKIFSDTDDFLKRLKAMGYITKKTTRTEPGQYDEESFSFPDEFISIIIIDIRK